MIDPQPYQLFTGDSLEILKGFADNSVDSIVCDGPYGLGKEPDPMEVLRDWLDHSYHEVKAKGGCMNKRWDNFVPQPLLWRECYRVLKPGGFLLSFFGTRTYDWGVMAIRLAGFSVRDTLQWIYGQGFPKSLDISKALDKMAGAKREVIGRDAKKWRNVENHSGDALKFKYDYYDTKAAITVPATQDAKQWDGWGTALKPANEPIVLAQKPISERNIALNVLKWGTGGLNINGCRVAFESAEDLEGATYGNQPVINGGNYATGPGKDIRAENVEANPQGRWPANVIHDGSPDVVQHFPHTESGSIQPHHNSGTDSGQKFNYGIYGQRNAIKYETIGDRGSAARFFYCSKASPLDRDEGLEGFELKEAGAMQGNQDGSRIRNGKVIETPQRANDHPTVKPTDLMRWLCRLVTPPGGIVLDPFCGSGSTGKGCMLEGLRFIGIDMDQKNIDLSRARIEFAKRQADRIARMGVQGTLF